MNVDTLHQVKRKREQESSRSSSSIADIVTSFSTLERRLDTHSPDNIDGAAWVTLHYVFHAHRAGILVVIDDGVVELVPFVNPRFDNRLILHGARLRLVLSSGAEAHSVEHYFNDKAEHTGQAREAFLSNVDTWWFNGHVVCNVLAPPGAPLWSPRGLVELHDMLQAAALSPAAPRRARLILNKRDAPLLGVPGAGRSVYPPLWRARAFLRPLSLYGGPTFHDVLVPTPEHWTFAKQVVRDAPPPWHSRANRAVFRGTATGPGSTLETNQRLVLAAWGLLHEDIADIGLTALSARDRVDAQHNVSFMNTRSLNKRVRCALPMTPREQAQAFKYQVYVDGHSASSRLAWLLLSRSLVLMVASPSRVVAPDMWLTGALALEPHKHFLPVCADLSDLEQKIRWAQDHDAEAEEIAAAGCAAAETILRPHTLTEAVAEALQIATRPVEIT